MGDCKDCQKKIEEYLASDQYKEDVKRMEEENKKFSAHTKLDRHLHNMTVDTIKLTLYGVILGLTLAYIIYNKK